eukprot:301079-Rhodomonas_salina.1
MHTAEFASWLKRISNVIPLKTHASTSGSGNAGRMLCVSNGIGSIDSTQSSQSSNENPQQVLVSESQSTVRCWIRRPSYRSTSTVKFQKVDGVRFHLHDDTADSALPVTPHATTPTFCDSVGVFLAFPPRVALDGACGAVL